MKNNQIKFIFYSLWFVALLWQAYFTELLGDEAYYWMYSNNLAWGYFDHPPIIAVFIKCGYALFNNELGVRLLVCISSLLTLHFWEKIIKPKKLWLFYALVSSVALVHAFGFFATPDAPFLLFSSAFLYAYKHFCEKETIALSLLLAVLIAFMVLSKYHAFLLIGLCLLSNLKLVKSKHFWAVVLLSIVLLMPHILWQINAALPSFQYHVFGRSREEYSLFFTLEYLMSLLYVFGPFVGFAFIYSLIKAKVNSQFEKSLLFIAIGTAVFFFFMSFKGRVEPHWTLIMLLPYLYFTYTYFSRNGLNRYVKWIGIVGVVLICLVRVIVAIELVPTQAPWKKSLAQFHTNKKWTSALHEKGNNLPVAFVNSYSKASLYSFYTGQEAFSVNNVMGRKNQFSIWNSDAIYRGKEVLFVPNYTMPEWDFIDVNSSRIYYTKVPNFQSFSDVELVANNLPETAKVNSTFKVNLQVTYKGKDTINFNANPQMPSFIFYQFYDGKKMVNQHQSIKLKNSMLNNVVSIDIEMPETTGEMGVYFSIKTGFMPETINSKKYNINILH